MNNLSPDTSHSRTGDFYAYILCLYCVYIVPIMCHSPIPCHARTTQAQDNFSFVYDIFARPQPHLPQLYKSITADISCTLHVSILCHYTHRQTRHPIPHYPSDHSPTLPHKPFPEIPQIPRCIVRPHRPTDDSSSNTHNSPHTFHIYVVPIICFYCVYIVSLHTAAYTSPEPIRRR